MRTKFVNPNRPTMKKVLLCCLAFAGVGKACGQAVILFDNRVAGGGEVDAPVFRPDGTGAGAGFTAGLFLVRADGSLEPLFPTTTFNISPPRWTPYVREEFIFFPETWGGEVVTVRMRAWETAAGSFEAALIRGESNDVQVGLHVGFPMSLVGLQGFTMVVVPEPGAGALLALGGAALALAGGRRRDRAGTASILP